MIGKLTRSQSERVLLSELVGRIGCSVSGKVYIVPVAYAFDGNFIYAHSKEGLKIKMMRKNPKVCFEVESRENLANWRTVIVWGNYRELKTPVEIGKGMKILNDRFGPYSLSESVKPTPYGDIPRNIERENRPVVYRISIEEISGKFEKS